MKICISCGLLRDDKDFRKRLFANNTCHECELKYKRNKRLENIEEERKKGREREKARREKDPEHVKNVSREWRKNNKNKVKENKDTWRKNNPEKERIYNKNKYEKDPLKWIKKAVEWARNNKERKEEHNRNRRAKKNGNGGHISRKEWKDLKEKYNYTCLCCGKKEPEIKITLDHVIPLDMGGSHSIDNVQTLCLSCNSRKRNKYIDYRSNHV